MFQIHKIIVVNRVSKCNVFFSGFTNDGEWNSLHSKGNTRLTSVFQIRANVRSKFARVGINKTMKIITLTHLLIVYGFIVMNIGNKDGIVAASVPNPTISTELLKEIQQWYDHGATVDDVIDRLRMKTVPPGYATHS